MQIGRKILQTALVGIFVAPSLVLAQSKIQCLVTTDGTRIATEQWRNTLGKLRADAACDAPRQLAEKAQREDAIAKQEADAKARQTYSISEGERFKSVLSRWARTNGFSEVRWLANDRTNFVMNAGDISATNFESALAQMISAANQKIAMQKAAQPEFASFLTPIEAVVYRNGVIVVSHLSQDQK